MFDFPQEEVGRQLAQDFSSASVEDPESESPMQEGKLLLTEAVPLPHLKAW